MKRVMAAFATVGMLVITGSALAQQVQVDSALPVYTAGSGVEGTIKSVGSDTLNNLMTLWTEEFKGLYPAAKVEVEGKGSSTAPPALTEGQAQFGPMSREMKGAEIDAFEKKFGYKPAAVRVAVDALAIYVHKDCPLSEISMDQARKIFSVDGPDMTWGDVGVKDAAWAGKPIALYGRNSASGTYGYFKEFALSKKDFKPSVKEQPGSSAVVQAIATDKFAMGYSGLGYKTADVKALKMAAKDGGKHFEGTAANAYSGEYPLSRFLYIYLNHKPGSTLEPLRGEFIRMVFSRQGQEVTVKDGYFPVTAEIAREDLRKLGLPVKF
jgi:phosphate transport system substrate-binding protein